MTSDHGWMAANPFLAPSPLPFGYPDFSAIREEHFLPAFVEGMARQRAEVDAIAADPVQPTFENTLVALERSGDVLGNDRALDAWIAAHLTTAVHLCGSAAMGRVVDPELRVLGVDGLRVADTSVLPVVPRRGPAATAVAIGEKAAALLAG